MEGFLQGLDPDDGGRARKDSIGLFNLDFG
jgi:hypothetical protein